jgi:hypothetical protein
MKSKKVEYTIQEKIEILEKKQIESNNEWVKWFVGECIQYLKDPNVLIEGFWDFKVPLPLQKCYNREQFNYYYETYINRMINKKLEDLTYTNIQYFNYPKNIS